MTRANHFYPHAGKGSDDFVAYTGRSSKEVKSGPRYRRRVSINPSIEAIAEEGRGTPKQSPADTKMHQQGSISNNCPETNTQEERRGSRRVSVGTEEAERLLAFYRARIKPVSSADEVEIASTIITTPSEYSLITSKQRLSIDDSNHGSHSSNLASKANRDNVEQ